MGIVTEVSHARGRATGWLREWCGWVGVMVWFFHMNNGYNYLPNGYSDSNIFEVLLAFKVILAFSVALAGIRFGRDPNGLGKLAFYTTPVAIAITAVFSFLPQPFGPVLFIMSSVFIAPAMVRRAYGVLRTAHSGYIFTAFMSGVAVAFALLRVNYFIFDIYTDKLLTDPPTKIFYLAYALFVLPAWFGVRRSANPAGEAPVPARRGLSKPLLFGLAAAVLMTFWLLKMKSLIDYAVEYFDYILFIPVYDILPSVSYIFLGLIGDRKRERPVVISSMVLYLISIQLVLLVGDYQNPMIIPLVFVNHFFGHIIEYLIYAIPIYFFTRAKRPVFAASLSIASYSLCWAFRWVIDPALPETLKEAGAPLFVSTAITAIMLFVTLHFIYARFREKTLAAALYALFHEGENEEAPAEGETSEPAEAREALAAALTRGEADVALLLIEGKTRGEILRRLHISAAEAGKVEDTIRRKLQQTSDPDPVTAAASEKFALTRRETQVLRCLRKKMTNPEIAAALFISDATVKVHVHNLLAKLHIENRRQVDAWAEEFDESCR